MSCHAIRNWTFSELVGAFLDLAIASLLLCASTLAYFASAFLSLFGLSLPCSCNGLFGNPNNGQNCLQSQLLRFPAQKISFVQCSVKNKFPFHSSWNLQQERNEKQEAADEAASCLSSSDRTEDLAKMKEKGFVIGAINLPDFKERKFPHRRSRSHNNLRRGRKGRSVNDNRKLPWNFSDRSLCSDESPPPSVTRLAEDHTNDDYSKDDINFRDGKEGLLDIGSKRKISHGFDLSESVDENEPINDENGMDDNNGKNNTIRLLQEALEEEHTARSVLYIELEKERNAASTAADEAMAMILRLQEEKASIEMESRQRQRIVEDRYVYDEEEMNILKEILVRREKEKYFLEKEVEAYRQLMCNEQFLETENPSSAAAALARGDFTLYLSDDESVVVMPQQNEDDTRSTMLEENEPPRNSSAVITEIVELFNSDEIENENKGVIHDVHVIDDKCIVSMEEEEKKNNTNNKMIPIPIPIQENSSFASSISTTKTAPVIISAGLPPTGKSKSWRSDLRRKSMSSFDAERFRIDSEICWLREKLKFVHEGREKLNLSKSMRGREKMMNQGQILEEITSHLREIRHLNEPGKAARRASLPPLSSNFQVMSKKKRWRSGTLRVQASI